MVPKKKGNKKGNDDWEAEIGETPDPIASAAKESKDTETAQETQETKNAQENQEDGLSGGGGGLLAALKKNRSRKQKKGKHVEEDYLEGEDPPESSGINGHTEADGIQDLAAKAPEEANADDLFDTQVTKVKDGKGKQGKVEEEANEPVDGDEGGGLKSKKEKEREKKEREKQRKKEQVGFPRCVTHGQSSLISMCRRQRRKQSRQRPRPT